MNQPKRFTFETALEDIAEAHDFNSGFIGAVKYAASSNSETLLVDIIIQAMEKSGYVLCDCPKWSQIHNEDGTTICSRCNKHNH